MSTTCPCCDAVVVHDTDTEQSVQAVAWDNHRRFCRQSQPTQPRPARRPVMEPTPINRRPSARDLAGHEDKRIARQAQRVREIPEKGDDPIRLDYICGWNDALDHVGQALDGDGR